MKGLLKKTEAAGMSIEDPIKQNKPNRIGFAAF
jgi:hypothetical protein